jgi:hypothetical protein
LFFLVGDCGFPCAFLDGEKFVSCEFGVCQDDDVVSLIACYGSGWIYFQGSRKKEEEKNSLKKLAGYFASVENSSVGPVKTFLVGWV